MKRSLIIVINILLSVVLVCTSMRFREDEKKELPLVKIDFPKYAGDIAEDLKFEVKIDDNYRAKNDSILDKFYIIDDNYENIIQRIEMICGIESEMVKKDNLMIKGNKEKNIKCYGSTAFLYSDNSCNNDVIGEMKVDDDTCKAIAKMELEKLELYDETIECYGVGYDIQTDLQTGEEIIISKTVYYDRKINNIEVEGNAKIAVTLNSDSDVKSIYYSLRNPSYEYNVKKENIRKISEAIEDCKKLEGYIEMPEGVNKILLDDVECVYWEDSAPNSSNNTLQPVYKFTGKAYTDGVYVGEFVAIETALEQ